MSCLYHTLQDSPFSVHIFGRDPDGGSKDGRQCLDESYGVGIASALNSPAVQSAGSNLQAGATSSASRSTQVLRSPNEMLKNAILDAKNYENLLRFDEF